MRIISQDGLTDVQYEHSLLNVKKNGEIYAFLYTDISRDNGISLGKYKDEEKAKIILARISAHYGARQSVYRMPQTW